MGTPTEFLLKLSETREGKLKKKNKSQIEKRLSTDTIVDFYSGFMCLTSFFGFHVSVLEPEVLSLKIHRVFEYGYLD